MLAALLRMPQAQSLGQEQAGPGASSSQEATWQLQQQLEMCRALEAAVAAFQLEGCWEWKPLLNGNQVISTSCVKLTRAAEYLQCSGSRGSCLPARGMLEVELVLSRNQASAAMLQMWRQCA